MGGMGNMPGMDVTAPAGDARPEGMVPEPRAEPRAEE
jgi:hypothetical protein